MMNSLRSIGFFSFTLLLTATLACATTVNDEPKNTQSAKKVAASVSEESKCNTNEECVLIPADCCGCNQGGKQRSINKKFLTDLTKRRQKDCANTFCIQMISKDPSCKATRATCEKGICVLSE
jgi:hypothetical protein